MLRWGPALEVEGEPPPVTESDAPGRSRTLAELPLLAALAVLIAFLVKSLVAQAFYIPSGSMIPQLEIGDRVVVSKVAYRLHPPRRGDVVVFDCPPRAACPDADDDAVLPVRVVRVVLEAVGLRQPSTEEYIKRVVALPGEGGEGRDGRVFVDGRELVEPYLPAGTVTSEFAPTTVGRDELWVMGDNRGQSADSRSFGTIDRDTVVGRAILRAWPLPRGAFL